MNNHMIHDIGHMLVQVLMLILLVLHVPQSDGQGIEVLQLLHGVGFHFIFKLF